MIAAGKTNSFLTKTMQFQFISISEAAVNSNLALVNYIAPITLISYRSITRVSQFIHFQFMQ